MDEIEQSERFLEELAAYVDDIKETGRKAEAVGTFQKQGLVSKHYAADEFKALSQRMLASSEAITRLIDLFLVLPIKDVELVNMTKKLVADSKTEIAHFRSQHKLGDDVQDFSTDSDSVN